ncbi:putative pumilio-family RNA binding repeat domain-containing protein [Colletotrichum truncatum]|uniref:Pumilio-family RNA binding repeat domain-containing protein n=1 Tax=Colletotrichum truncatum TaxID=5467 RepID=A0ACC3Z6D4_COLTU|nr:putative pumilio-family RNA binding repeat domain-containing protein [Colletotrichum truncatum]KAF6788114.1 putative pumilio-family RNA binding repeat domain-containing protein [Colletotrichum truncatum]
MPKPRTKRQAIRDERKKKRREAHEENFEEPQSKRRRVEGEEQETEEPIYDDAGEQQQHFPSNGPEKEFFGMLADEEQEYFRRADELLELNQFPSSEERDVFLQNIYKEARGKELKLASSQSLSRLMERLILLSNTKQKKQIFNAFAGHFLSLVQHRFASHCCETLFLQSAPLVTQELGGLLPDETAEDDEEQNEGEEGAPAENTMENLFLLTLDEFEQHMGFLLTDRFGSHTLRVLLVVLSGRPLEDSATKSMLKSKKKEHISVHGAAASSNELSHQLRAVPESFTLATKKIIQDAVAGMDFTALRVLAKHPTGNPLLQLLLELDISLNHKSDKSSAASSKDTLLYRLLPDAPASLSDSTSQAADFVNSMVYDQIGSRLLETLITHCPGKIFKALSQNFFGERIATYVRNDIASYPALRVLNRFSKDDLVEAVKKILPAVPILVTKARYNVLKTLFERCEARGAYEEKSALTRALTNALGPNPKDLVPKLCHLVEDEPAEKEEFQQVTQNKTAVAAHGAHLVTAMLKTTGNPSKAAQKSLMALPSDLLLQLATQSMATVNVLTTALANPAAPQNEIFHKALVGALVPHIGDLAQSQNGHNIVNAIIDIPSRGKDRSVPFHVKQTIMAALAEHERTLRDSWFGRSVWRTWKGDMWKTRRSDWVKWAKEVDGPADETRLKPWERRKLEQQQKGPLSRPQEKKEPVEENGE